MLVYQAMVVSILFEVPGVGPSYIDAAMEVCTAQHATAETRPIVYEILKDLHGMMMAKEADMDAYGRLSDEHQSVHISLLAVAKRLRKLGPLELVKVLLALGLVFKLDAWQVCAMLG
jgi:hypothetical protein